MQKHQLITRRLLLRDMGRAGLALMLIGTAACAPGVDREPAGTEGPSGPGEPQPTEGSPPPQSDTTVPPSTEGSRAGYDWRRANLGFVSAYILYRNGEAAIVDTGVEDSEDAIGEALAQIGLGWEAVGSVIITHKHPDHQGSLEAVLGLATKAPWYAGAGDLPLIFSSVRGAPVGDGDRVFDLEIIETPGHTPGHISVLDPAGGILVAGDAINGAGGGVIGPNPDFTEDMGLANLSVTKLAGFDYEVILFGHGDPVTSGGADAVRRLSET
jgi:glyoxylase-like metal-dependent hydrolase (beta-lactamase superfamily II)